MAAALALILVVGSQFEDDRPSGSSAAPNGSSGYSANRGASGVGGYGDGNGSGGGAGAGGTSPRTGAGYIGGGTAFGAGTTTGSDTATTDPGSVPTIRCADGTWSYARNTQGACSWHGGIAGGDAPATSGTPSWVTSGVVDTAVLGDDDLETGVQAFAGNDADAAGIQDTVHSYYDALTKENFRTAYDLLSAERKAQVGTRAEWAGTLQGNRYTVLDVDLAGQRDGTPIVQVEYLVDYARGAAKGSCERITVRRAVPLERMHLRLSANSVYARTGCY